MPVSPPVVLTIAGSDSSCGAGAQADIKVVAALGGYGLNALTSVVSETPGRVSQFCLLEPDFIADQMRVLFGSFPIAAAKTGMIGGRAQVEAVAGVWRELAGSAIPLVVDPVMVATSGDRLIDDGAIAAIEELLLPLARVITPNMDEAAVLAGGPIRSRQQMADCARALAARYRTAVLVKGGHLADDEAADVLCDGGRLTWFESRRVEGVHTHGTGCAYSAAIATGLACGLPLDQAVGEAKQFISAAIAKHFAWTGKSGQIHALNHFHSS